MIPSFTKLKVSGTGKVTIRFSEKLLIPGKPEEIDSEVLDLKIIQGTNVDPKYLGFSWNLTEFAIDNLKL